MVIHEAAKLLTNSDTPLIDARALLSHVIGSDSRMLFRPLTKSEQAEFSRCIERRKNGEPVAYITGEKEFMALSFKVNPHVLIPRPDTETVVEYILEKFRGKQPRILDLCCGSGCIGISLCKYLPLSGCVLADISSEALGVARENARRHNVTDCCTFIELDALKDVFPTGFDIIVSNPPYIPTETANKLEVAKTEPIIALDGGSDGLSFYSAITPKAYAALNRGGTLVYEIGYDQRESVAQLLEKNGFSDIVAKKDYGDNYRLVAGEKNDYSIGL